MNARRIQSPAPHAALFWLIRGTCALLSIFVAVAFVFTVRGLLVAVYALAKGNPAPTTGGLCMILLFLIIEALFLKGSYYMVWKVDAGAMALFAFIFAVLLAVAYHHFLPPVLPPFLAHNLFLGPFIQKPGHPELTNRLLLSMLVFLLSQKYLNAYLTRTLVSPPGFAKDPPPSGNVDPVVSV